MAEFEGQTAAGQESNRSVVLLLVDVAKVLLQGFVVTLIAMGYLSVVGPSFNWVFYWPAYWFYPLFTLVFVCGLLAFGAFEGSLNRSIGRAFWSVSGRPILADIFLRGLTVLALSVLIIAFVAVPALSALYPPPPVGDLAGIALLALLVLVASALNGPMALAIARWNFGLTYEEKAAPNTTPGICPHCKATYHYSLSQIANGQVACQNCGRPFRLVAEGPSVG